LKRVTGNDIGKAASYNLVGNKNASDDYRVGKNMSVGEYKKRIIR
jgi:hypothetical protein